jgi:hypothetical protein
MAAERGRFALTPASSRASAWNTLGCSRSVAQATPFTFSFTGANLASVSESRNTNRRTKWRPALVASLGLAQGPIGLCHLRTSRGRATRQCQRDPKRNGAGNRKPHGCAMPCHADVRNVVVSGTAASYAKQRKADVPSMSRAAEHRRPLSYMPSLRYTAPMLLNPRNSPTLTACRPTRNGRASFSPGLCQLCQPDLNSNGARRA